MAGLDPELNRRLMATLRRCDAFSSNAELRNVFTANTPLSPWAYNVPEAASTYSRVQATVAFLHDKANVQGQNALVLLLEALQDRYAPGDVFISELSALIAALGGGTPAPSTAASPSSPVQSVGGQINYEAGISALLAHLGTAHPRHSEALVYQQRLNDNQKSSRLFGDTEIRRAERAEIIMQLNSLSLAALGVAFNELAGMSPSTAGQPTTSPPAANNITSVGDGNVIGSNNQVAVGQPTASTPTSSSPGLPDRLKLLSLLKQHFSLDELNTLCFAVEVNYDELSGVGVSGKARELIGYCERHLCLPKLVTAGKTLRPELDWS